MTTTLDQNSTRFQLRLRDLFNVLTELLRWHEELVEVIQRKLHAMRKSDASAIYQCVLTEEKLVARIQDREVLRKRLMVFIGQELGLDEKQSRAMSFSQLAEKLDQHKSLHLKSVTQQLSKLMADIAKVNAVVTTFAHQMLSHYRHVFSELTSGLTESAIYARHGRQPNPAQACMVDATV